MKIVEIMVDHITIIRCCFFFLLLSIVTTKQQRKHTTTPKQEIKVNFIWEIVEIVWNICIRRRNEMNTFITQITRVYFMLFHPSSLSSSLSTFLDLFNDGKFS